MDNRICFECGEAVVILDNGVAHHVTEDGETDHDQDADHVAVPEEETFDRDRSHRLR